MNEPKPSSETNTKPSSQTFSPEANGASGATRGKPEIRSPGATRGKPEIPPWRDIHDAESALSSALKKAKRLYGALVEMGESGTGAFLFEKHLGVELLPDVKQDCVDLARVDEDGFPYETASGVRQDEYGESGVAWVLFTRSRLPKGLAKKVYHFDLDPPEDPTLERCVKECPDELIHLLCGWDRFSNGVGRAFGAMPNIKITKGHVLVTQFRGLDI